MLRVQLEHALRLHLAHAVGHLRHEALHLKRHGALGGDGGRRIGQARGHGHLGDRVAELLLHGGEQGLVVLLGFLGLLLLLLGGEVQVARRHVLELLGAGSLDVLALGVLLGLGTVGHHGLEAELVDVLRAQQHVVALAEHRVHDRQLRQAVDAVAGGVVDGLLVGGHGLEVLGQRDHLLLLGAVEQQQVGQLVFEHAVAGVDAILQAAAEVLEELLVGGAIVLQHLLQLAGDLLLHLAGDGVQLVVLLQRLTRDVEREVLAVHDAADEVVVVGQQVLALLHDQHVGAVQLQALLVVLAVQVVRRAAGDEQQRIIGQRSLGVDGERSSRVGEVVEGLLVELVVLFLLYVGLAALPDRHHGVDGLDLGVLFVLGLIVVASILGLGLLAGLRNLHAHGVAHVVAVALDEVLQAVLAEELVEVLLVGVVLQGQDDVGAVALALGLLDGVALDAVGFPGPGLVAAVGLRHHAHGLRHHERAVEAHAELADDVDVVALLLGVLLLEGHGIGMGDGAQVAVQILLRHADAVVGHGDGAGVLVEGDVDAELILRQLDAGVGEAFEVQLVDGVRRVGDELAQEDLAIGVDGVDHQIEQLLALCLELAHVRRFLSVRAWCCGTGRASRRRFVYLRRCRLAAPARRRGAGPCMPRRTKRPAGAGRVSSLTA